MKAYPRLNALGSFVPYVAVVTAGSCNVAFTRMDEIRNGVAVPSLLEGLGMGTDLGCCQVVDGEGNERGLSVTAGKLAVFKTVTTRSMFLPIFPLLIPPVGELVYLLIPCRPEPSPAVTDLVPLATVMSALPLKPMTTPHSLATLAVITVSIAAALPIALALEPGQVMTSLVCDRFSLGLTLFMRWVLSIDVVGGGVARARIPRPQGLQRGANPGPVCEQGLVITPA